jgi:hypothetical protein
MIVNCDCDIVSRDAPMDLNEWMGKLETHNSPKLSPKTRAGTTVEIQTRLQKFRLVFQITPIIITTILFIVSYSEEIQFFPCPLFQ